MKETRASEQRGEHAQVQRTAAAARTSKLSGLLDFYGARIPRNTPRKRAYKLPFPLPAAARIVLLSPMPQYPHER